MVESNLKEKKSDSKTSDKVSFRDEVINAQSCFSLREGHLKYYLDLQPGGSCLFGFQALNSWKSQLLFLQISLFTTSWPIIKKKKKIPQVKRLPDILFLVSVLV